MAGKKNRDRIERFIELYNGNGAETAIAAGYAPKSARVTACRLLRDPEVIERLKNRPVSKERKEGIANREERQAFWTKIIRGKMYTNYIENGKRKKKYATMKERLKASELLGRSEADFTDNIGLKDKPTVIIKDLTGDSNN